MTKMPTRVPSGTASPYAMPSGAAAPRSSSGASHHGSAVPMTTGNIRRNLFASTLSRRPTTSSSDDTIALSPTGGLNASAADGQQHREQQEQHQIALESDRPLPDDMDMIVRDEATNNALDPSLFDALDPEDDDAAGDSAKMLLCARLLDMYRSQSRSACVDPVELRAAVQASLTAKLASLEADRWMFEDEPETDMHV